MKLTEFYKKKVIIISLFLITFFILIFPLICLKAFSGDDFNFHISRAIAISQQFSFGDFQAKLQTAWINGYGYGCGLFYPNFFIYIPAFLIYIGFGHFAAMKLFFAFISILTIISSYFSAKYIFKSRASGIVCMVLYSLSCTFISNLYTRCAVGESLASIFFPIIICALYNLTFEKFSKPYIFVLGFLGLLLSHTLSFEITFFVAIIYMAFYFKRIFLLNNKFNIVILRKLVLSVLFILILSAAYLFPMVEQLLSGQFTINHMQNLLWPLKYPFINFFPGRDVLLLSVGVPLVIFSFIMLLNIKLNKQDKNNKFEYKLLFFGVILGAIPVLPLASWLIDHTILNSIQFTFRFYSISCAFLAIAVSGFTKTLISYKKTIFNSFFISAVLLSLIVGFLHTSFYIYKFKPYENTSVYTGPQEIVSIMTGEWLPYPIDKLALNNTNLVESDNQKFEIEDKSNGVTTFDSNGSYYFDAPLIYYKGYSAYIIDKNNTKVFLETSKSLNNSLVRVSNPQKLEGKIYVYYGGTAIQNVSYIITMLTFISTIVFIIYRKIIKKKSINGLTS